MAKVNYNKYKFSKQLTEHDCAAVAIANLVKFNGASLSYKKHKSWFENKLKINKNHGTSLVELVSFLSKTKLPKTKLENIALNLNTDTILYYLELKKPLLLAYETNLGGHACLIVDYKKTKKQTYFIIVNFISGKKKVVQKISIDNLLQKALCFNKSVFFIFKGVKNVKKTIKSRNPV
jgi:hypothetical protein